MKKTFYEFSKGKWWFRFHAIRLHWKGKKFTTKSYLYGDVLFFFHISYGGLSNKFAEGFSFHIDALRFKIDVDKYQAPGFDIVTKNMVAKAEK